VGHRRNKRGNPKVPGIYQNLWDTAKEVLTGKFIAKTPYTKNTEGY
jgi:hypothetical protein